MSRRNIFRTACAFLATLTLSFPAYSVGLFRAYLASDGNDANPCTLAQPCRLLPAALSAIQDGGEIWMLDSANFNSATVVVGKSVSVLAVPGAVGSVVALGGPAISITADGLKVSLQNLVVVPLPGAGATHGVVMTGASFLTITRSVIANLPNNGVYVVGTGTLKIANTIVRDCGLRGIVLESGASAEVISTQMLANTFGGLWALSLTASTTTASMSDSVVSGPANAGTSAGVWATAQVAGSAARVHVTRSTIQGHSYALGSEQFNGGLATLSISYNMVVNNANGWYATGTIFTLLNNHFVDNPSHIGSLTTTPPQ